MMDAQRWLITRDIHTLVFVTAVVRTKTRAPRTPPRGAAPEKPL
jgi:hypothetical protein